MKKCRKNEQIRKLFKKIKKQKEKKNIGRNKEKILWFRQKWINIIEKKIFCTDSMKLMLI